MAKSAKLAETMLTINATFINPGCDITVPSFYDLGTLTPGRKEHSPLSIVWNCTDTPVRTALTASVIRGKLEASEDKLQLIIMVIIIAIAMVPFYIFMEVVMVEVL